MRMLEHLEGQRAEPPWGAFGNRSIPTLSGACCCKRCLVIMPLLTSIGL